MYKRNKTIMNDDGISLVEVIVAITMLGLVIAALSPFLMNSLRISNDNSLRNESMHVMKVQLDEARENLSGQECSTSLLPVQDVSENARVQVRSDSGYPGILNCPTSGSNVAFYTVEVESLSDQQVLFTLTESIRVNGVE